MGKENGVMFQYFEWYLPADASLWRTVSANAQELSDKGVTSVWLPPAYKGQAGIDDTGYGVYDMYDLGEFDQKGTVPTKYGTRDEYIDAVKNLQACGIDVYADIVLNHRMGADETEAIQAVKVNQENRTETVSDPKTIEAWTKFTFPGRNGQYSDFIWDHTCFNGVDYDELKDKSAIYKFKGVQWNHGVDHENVNYDYLMGANVDFNVPKVREELTRWGQWYLDTTDVHGFRLDAVKHIEKNFFPEWLGKLRANNHKELFAVGEYWNSEIGILMDYLKSCGGCMSLFDVPLHFHFFEASNSGGEYDMRGLLQDTLVQRDPTHAVTFVDIDLMMDLRQTHVYGAQHDYFDDPDVVGWTMEGDEAHGGNGLAVVLTNRTGDDKAMYAGKQHAGETWIDTLGNMKHEIVIDEEGYGVFSCADGSLSIWIKKQ